MESEIDNKIIKHIRENGRARCIDIQSNINIPQSTTTEHLHKLENIGILRSKKVGMSTFYMMIDVYENLINIIEGIETQYYSALEQIKAIKKILKQLNGDEVRII